MLFAIIRYILILIYLKTKKSYITGVEKDTNRMQWKVLQFLGKLKRNSNPNQMLNCPLQYKKWHSSKMIYCYWLRASNLRRYIMTFRWSDLMTSKRLKSVTWCLFQPINQDIFTQCQTMNTTKCSKIKSLKI